MNTLALQDQRTLNYFYTEAVKTLRTNIQMSGKDIKTILFTSCYPNEGKSDVTLSLSQEFASIEKKVLLLDTDIRKSSYTETLGIKKKTRGLSEFLCGQASPGDIIYATNYPHMHMVLGGASTPNPSGLLSTELFRTFLKELRNFYDYILIDTPPIGMVIDAAVVAENCDGAVFVIEPDAVSYKAAQKAMSQLHRCGCPVIGAVLNKVDSKNDRYYSSHYGYYASYYAKTNPDK